MKTFACDSQRGTCLVLKATSGDFRIMSAYINRGMRLSIHANIIDHKFDSNNNITIYVQAGELPSQRKNDFKITGRDPGFSQFTCYGVMLYWRLQLNIDVLEKQEVDIGITLTEDECITKNYEADCPLNWLAKSGNWCQPPTDYTGPCRSQNYFGTQNIRNGFSNPSSWEYKMLWSERCDADWPCKIHVKNKCGALLHHFHNGKWKKLALKKELNHFGSFKLPSIKNEISIQLYSVDVPPGSIVLIKVIPSLEPYLNRFKEASENISKKSELIISRTLYNINKMNENFSIILIS